MSEFEKSSQNFDLTAPCGICCGVCEFNMAKDEPKLLQYFALKGIDTSHLPCDGCRQIKCDCISINGICKTFTCVKEHDIDFCYECNDFPCEKLQPSFDRADVLPHNMKVFNICVIRNQGLNEFVEKVNENKQKYYKGKMEIGNGPHIEVTQES